MATAVRSRSHIIEKVRSQLSTRFIHVSAPRSPVPHLLASNGIPTEEERKLIREAIADTEARIVSLEDEEDVGGADSIKRARRRLVYEEFLRAHKALLVPIRNLPSELLQEIFLLYADTSIGYHRWVRLPFVLGQICHSWRLAAIKLPGLWDKLPCFKLSASTKSPSYLSFLEQLLRRSGTSETLRVYVRAPFKEIKDHPIIALLSRHSKRIQTLTIESGFTTVNAFKGMKGRLNNLQELELLFWTRLTEGTVDIFEVAPKLRKVTVMGRCPPELSLPWSQLTAFKERYDGGVLSKVLVNGSENLTSLEVVKNNHHELQITPSATLKALKTLRVRLDDPSDISSMFFENLTLPAIEDIRVCFGGSLVPHLTTMLSRTASSRSLQRLAFRCVVGLQAFQLKDLFKHIPQLLELDVDVTDGDDAPLAPLVNVKTSPIVLPLLQTLSIHVRSAIGMEDSLNSIANARCQLAADNLTAPSIYADPKDLDFTLELEARELKTFRVTFPGREARHKAQFSLNKWKVPATSRQFRDTAKLDTWRRELVDLLPDFFSEPLPTSPDPPSRPKFPAKWNGMFHEMELFGGPDSISLRASKLHLILFEISHAPRRYEARDSNSYIRRAASILASWKSAFLPNLTEYKWVMTGKNSLVYVPASSPIRTSDRAADNLVYGLEDDVKHEDVLWPNYI